MNREEKIACVSVLLMVGALFGFIFFLQVVWIPESKTYDLEVCGEIKVLLQSYNRTIIAIDEPHSTTFTRQWRPIGDTSWSVRDDNLLPNIKEMLDKYEGNIYVWTKPSDDLMIGVIEHIDNGTILHYIAIDFLYVSYGFEDMMVE